MKQVTEMEWTDGTAKALKVVASQIEKREKNSHHKDEDYYSNPQVMVTDMLTGSTVMLVPEPHTGGKTHGTHNVHTSRRHPAQDASHPTQHCSHGRERNQC